MIKKINEIIQLQLHHIKIKLAEIKKPIFSYQNWSMTEPEMLLKGIGSSLAEINDRVINTHRFDRRQMNFLSTFRVVNISNQITINKHLPIKFCKPQMKSNPVIKLKHQFSHTISVILMVPEIGARSAAIVTENSKAQWI